jgi:hypothetical protein
MLVEMVSCTPRQLTRHSRASNSSRHFSSDNKAATLIPVTKIRSIMLTRSTLKNSSMRTTKPSSMSTSTSLGSLKNMSPMRDTLFGKNNVLEHKNSPKTSSRTTILGL